MQHYEGSNEEAFTVEGYDVDRIYSRSTNKYGTGSTVQHSKILASVMAAVHKVVARSDTPYRSPADFIRDSVVHRLWYWQGKSEEEVFDPLALRMADAEAETALFDAASGLVGERRQQLSKATGEYRRYIEQKIFDDIAALPDRFVFIKDELRKLL